MPSANAFRFYFCKLLLEKQSDDLIDLYNLN